MGIALEREGQTVDNTGINSKIGLIIPTSNLQRKLSYIPTSTDCIQLCELTLAKSKDGRG